ncbi:endophilin-B1-like isoform X1 [Pseudochaenichthys georgianus]|uniref:endophilin-B1-like isoform X1 n=1 Tax=Pseudochaenichthys georgianus TaxID=52239 RepID=UPI00146BDA9A|nr:endophilin-B1-like isoform X1 [Pseudochaenichthys georgianus]
MDLTRLAVDAGQFINRAVQYTEESLGQAEKTGLNSGLEERLALVEATKTWTDQIISQTEVLLQPNTGARLEDRLYEQLDWSVPPRPRAHEVLGDHMTQAGLEMGSNTPYGTALLRFGETQKRLGETERNLVQSTNIHFLTPLRSFTEGEYRAMQDERKMLVNKRLDLDIAKTRLRKAHEADREGRNLNANPMENDYMAHVSYMFSFLRVKWLKMWAQEISQAEMELGICQSLFNRQTEITGRVVEGIGNTHTNHMRSLTDFVEAQACYFDQCNQHAQELQKQLASIPIVLCSNNWQLAIGDEVTQLSPNNHVANEPVGFNQVTAVPIEVHNNPDFSQDSWTANPPASTERSTASTVTTQQNNNNNNLFSDGPATSHCSVVNQALHHVSTANSDSHCTNQIAAFSRTTSAQSTAATAETTNGAARGTTTVPPPSHLPGNESHNGNASASDTVTTNDMTTETLTTNGMSAERQTANEIASKQPTVNGEDVQESSASQDMGQ